ncbi:glycine cleavage system protein GcvH [bacterium]|nr:glycine cleavage system protein GcvH [bacterium]
MDAKSLLYTKSHEWIEPAGSKRKIGITDFAQGQLGDIVYVEFPKTPKTLAAGDEACVIESCKATASVYAPVAGTIVAVNSPLTTSPEKVNQSPLDEGWLFELELDPSADTSALLDLAAYEKFCKEEA